LNDFFNLGAQITGYKDDRTVKFSQKEDGSWRFGEHNSNGKLNGRGIYLSKFGTTIGYWSDDVGAPGNYICIRNKGDEIEWGECYLDNSGTKKYRGIVYKKNGDPKKFPED
jgi:hypothetical protein